MNSRRGNRKQRSNFNRRRRPQNFSSGGHKHNTNVNARREFRHTEQLSEAEVGITEYISELEGFTGVIKARFSDFHVNEIDLNDEVAILTNTDIPKEKKVNITNITDQTPIDLLPQSVWTDIVLMIKSDSKGPVEFDMTDISKEDRRKIYEKIKEICGSKIVAGTKTQNEKKIAEFKKPNPGEKIRFTWSKDRPDYVHFLVYKEALDTMNACYQIAEAVRMKPSLFAYAGIKDKRAKTTQWFCVKQVDPWKLIIKTKGIRNIKIGNITFKDNPLKLGDLNGNRFKIALRNVVCEDAIIEKAVEHVREHGFINYYGLQRFGNDKEVPTYSVGLQLLLGQWKEACELILKPKMSDEPELDITKAKKVYTESGDAEKAYECLEQSKNNCVEGKLLQGLMKESNNAFVNALSNIPRNMRLLYIHSFQSLIWNMMVSKRIKKFGLQPVEHDLVVVNNVFVEPEMVHIGEEEEEDNSTKFVKDEEVKEEKIGNTVQDADSKKEVPKPVVKALTKSDLSDYTFFDIVLPLPGYDIEYPENMKEEYRDELEKHGLTLEMPKQNVKTYTLSGAYRKILGRAQDLKWKIMKYNDPNGSLILSDFDILRKFEQPKDVPDGRYKAAILELSLDSASYATMVLREIMKIDTSPSAQVKLNDYAGLNKSKKITLTNGGPQEKFETIDGNVSGSLLNNEQKLEEFKKTIFAEGLSKRKNEGDGEQVEKKIKTDN